MRNKSEMALRAFVFYLILGGLLAAPGASLGQDAGDRVPDDRWMQYMAYFSGPGDVTPILSDVSIYYFSTGIFVVSVTGGSYCLVSDNISQWGAGWSTVPEIHVEVSQR